MTKETALQQINLIVQSDDMSQFTAMDPQVQASWLFQSQGFNLKMAFLLPSGSLNFAMR